ncbi:MAG TPA: DUF2845 domain-containing protein [Methylibium sp.]|uniref:DUF2845 domain-containing protein n=1 Tax=Methylibium sp. TaxID=2067992 RepID=UPI002DB79C2E|nr:DUF2845 domain-containing protein [Methylibium sp.]HEU4458894.1 DUF2845 domain-containing protein [Methylibium sp.]
MPARLLAVLIATGAIAPSAFAQSLKCRNDFSQLGDTKGAILLKCGEPVAKDSFCKPADAPQAAGTAPAPCETVDEWTYKPGYGQFITTLRFESGVLKSVRYGDRVK